MGDFGFKIAKPGNDAATADPKNLIMSSKYPCLKILQLGKESAVGALELGFEAIVSLPIVVLVFLYDSATSKYEPIEAEFSTTKLYLPGGEAAGSYYYYFICYA